MLHIKHVAPVLIYLIDTHAGKREKLSGSLLSRFQPVVFTELPRSDWEDIIAARLASGGLQPASLARALAQKVVTFHMEVRKIVSGKSAFPEVRHTMQINRSCHA